MDYATQPRGFSKELNARMMDQQRNAVWSIGAGLVLTRIVLLAHWASDVVAGLVVGAVTERILRLVTGYGRERDLLTCKPEATRVLSLIHI